MSKHVELTESQSGCRVSHFFCELRGCQPAEDLARPRQWQPGYITHLHVQSIQQHSSMAPLRRYLRISKYSVLECRIYLDNPSLVYSWLLNPRDPVLPKVIESIRPLVLPKLREERERERNKKKSSKKKTVKDVVVEGFFFVFFFDFRQCHRPIIGR